jgi:hypothetical protein
MSNEIISTPSEQQPKPRAKEYDMSIHSDPDAREWAKFWISNLPNIQGGYVEAVQDEAFMTAWFANAMMAMHDHMKNQDRKRAKECDHLIGVIPASHSSDGCCSEAYFTKQSDEISSWENTEMQHFTFCPDCGTKLP